LETVVRASPNVERMSMVPWRHRRTFIVWHADERPWGMLGLSQGYLTPWKHWGACRRPRIRDCP
jgi:hypothetical protein